MRSQAGFTFTELLAVATILAMLAAVAVPRYAMLNSETRSDAVRALAANVTGSAALANRVWQAAGQPARLTFDGHTVELRFGYPTERSIGELVVMSPEFRFGDGYFKHAQSKPGQGCAVLYIPPPNPDQQASVISYTDGC
jgi:prepilin-type N-terminal cleavage/methylation domain-containing protein